MKLWQGAPLLQTKEFKGSPESLNRMRSSCGALSLNLRVTTIANREIVSVEAESTVEEAARVMALRNIGAVAVRKGGEIVGIMTERDVLKRVVAAGRDPRTTRVEEVMSSPPISVEANATVGEAVDLMNRRGIRRIFVREGQRIVGIFTQRDVLALMRVCLYCLGEILRTPGAPMQGLIGCRCGALYHTDCAKTVVYCIECGSKLVELVEYPSPDETVTAD
jgi:CBS domain-containing protein